MERSFAFRRIEITDDCLTLEQMFDKYPFLQEIDIVSNIFTSTVCIIIIVTIITRRKMEFCMCPASGYLIHPAHDRAKFAVKKGNVSNLQTCHAHFFNQEIPFFV